MFFYEEQKEIIRKMEEGKIRDFVDFIMLECSEFYKIQGKIEERIAFIYQDDRRDKEIYITDIDNGDSIYEKLKIYLSLIKILSRHRLIEFCPSQYERMLAQMVNYKQENYRQLSRLITNIRNLLNDYEIREIIPHGELSKFIANNFKTAEEKAIDKQIERSGRQLTLAMILAVLTFLALIVSSVIGLLNYYESKNPNRIHKVIIIRDTIKTSAADRDNK
ncbi:MAG: hypothetical protein QG635_474 [Bacteroidota bacterium]|nr:hypothetical protein [Bacteroidota bacterium]